MLSGHRANQHVHARLKVGMKLELVKNLLTTDEEYPRMPFFAAPMGRLTLIDGLLDVRSSGGSCSDADAVTHGRASSCVGCVKRHSQAAGRRAWDACSNVALTLRLQRRWEGREVLSLPSWPFSRLVAAAGQPGQDGGTSLDCPATPASTQIGKMQTFAQVVVAVQMPTP